MKTHTSMDHSNLATTELLAGDFARFIERGAGKLTPREVHQLISELPDIRGQFSRFRDSLSPETEHQLHFLAHVVESIWTEVYRDAPYAAALEAAFAIAYFSREADLIPDTLGATGLIDDCAVVQHVLIRNAPAYEEFRTATKFDWLKPRP